MPDILIRGVRTPVACSDCPSRVVSVCRWTDNAVDRYQYEKPSFCPLIELPPHGDLIDRDGLPKERVEWEDIDAAPVIVPAEREETT